MVSWALAAGLPNSPPEVMSWKLSLHKYILFTFASSFSETQTINTMEGENSVSWWKWGNGFDENNYTFTIDFSIERKMADTKGQNTSMISELSSNNVISWFTDPWKRDVFVFMTSFDYILLMKNYRSFWNLKLYITPWLHVLFIMKLLL